MNAGDTIKAGTLVLLTTGEYEQYDYVGLYRAEADVVIPPARQGGKQPHIGRLMDLMTQVSFTEVWGDF